MANPEKIERAFFQVDGSSEKIDVHFNPETLQYTVTNNMRNQGSGNTTKQYVSDSTGKLTMDLIFDSTGSGEDIRLKTVKIASFMEPTEGSGNKKTPPKVNFEWGLYKFTGLAQSFKETLDYFSPNGIPLRSSVNITLSSQEKVFEASKGGGPDQPNNAVPAGSLNTSGATGVATRAGNPAAAKGIASSNGLDSMRLPSASFELDASVSLQGPSDFSSAGVSLDLGVDISASGGAFAGLHAGADIGASATLDLDSFISADISGGLGLDATSIGPGGGAGLQGSASLKAEVGQAGEFKSRIEFDGG